MKKAVLRYSTYAGIAEFVFFFLTWLFITVTGISHKVQGYISYVSIICPLLFVYFGIRYYRDVENNGAISLLKGIQIGLLMVIIPALAFALVETVYVLYIHPKFYDEVFAYDIEEYRKTMSPEAFAKQLIAMKQEIAMDKNPVYNFIIMFLTIGATGVLVTLASAVLLMRRTKKAITS
jgi:hypothetical protein